MGADLERSREEVAAKARDDRQEQRAPSAVAPLQVQGQHAKDEQVGHQVHEAVVDEQRREPAVPLGPVQAWPVAAPPSMTIQSISGQRCSLTAQCCTNQVASLFSFGAEHSQYDHSLKSQAA